MNIFLISIIWLQGSPVLQTQPLASIHQCTALAQAAVQMVQGQATSNMTSGHSELQIAHDAKTNSWTVKTGIIGREMARFQCLST